MWIMKGTVVGAVLFLAFTVYYLKSAYPPAPDQQGHRRYNFDLRNLTPAPVLVNPRDGSWIVDPLRPSPVELHSMTHYRIPGAPPSDF